MKKHLDLGSGRNPRNPYDCEVLLGLDIVQQPLSPVPVTVANLAVEKIPFEDNSFDSISAFDFIEHIPRQIHSLTTLEFRSPFIELMNEVYRVLKPGGKFYALTPAYPNPQAFQDPTHVNIITDTTHLYFCGSSPSAQMYGFTGSFDTLRCEWVLPKNAFKARKPNVSESLRHWHRKLFRPQDISHVVWELVALKN